MRRLWQNSLVVKFFLSYLAVVTLLFTSFYLYSSTVVRDFYVSSLGERLELEARLIANALPSLSDNDEFDALCRNLANDLLARITIVGADGRVLCDSVEASTTMENHRGRPEVVEALKTGSGSSFRYSTTTGEELFYRAFLQDEGESQRIVRLAIGLDQVQAVTNSLRGTLFLGFLVASAVGLLLALAFSRRLSRRVKRLVEFSGQVAEGVFPQNFFGKSGRDEINRLERHLNDMSEKIRQNVQQVIAEKDKPDSILRGMMEGVL